MLDYLTNVWNQLRFTCNFKLIICLDIYFSTKMNLGKFSEIFDKKKTFRPKKKFQPGTMKYSLHKQAQASLNSGINLRQVVKLPKVIFYEIYSKSARNSLKYYNRVLGQTHETQTLEWKPNLTYFKLFYRFLNV